MSFVCSRCGAKEGQFEKTPYPGPHGVLILENVCGDCWKAWIEASLIMLNEYRLNLLDAKHAELYDKQLLAFFNLGNPEDDPKMNLNAVNPIGEND